MKITDIHIDGFGILTGDYTLAEGKTNLIIGSNEQGKSTLADFLLHILYGLPRERKSKDKSTKRELFKPKTSQRYSGYVRVMCGGRQLEIARDFDSNTVRVVDVSSGKDITNTFPSSKKHQHIGEELVGVSYDVFQKTAFVAQEQITHLTNLGDVTASIQKFTSSENGDTAAAEVIGKLRESLYKFNRITVSSPQSTTSKRTQAELEIETLRKKIQQNDEELQKLTGIINEAEENMQTLAGVREEMNTLKKKQGECEYCLWTATLREKENDIKHQQKLRNETAALQKEAEALAHFESFPIESSKEFFESCALYKNNLSAITRKENYIKDELSPHRKDLNETLEGFDHFLIFTDEDIAEISRLFDEEKQVKEKCDETMFAIERIRRNPQYQDVDFEKAEDMKNRLDVISAEDRNFLNSYALHSSTPSDRRKQLQIQRNDKEMLIEMLKRKCFTSTVFAFIFAGLSVAGTISSILSALQQQGILLTIFVILTLVFAGSAAAFLVIRRHNKNELLEKFDKEVKPLDEELQKATDEAERAKQALSQTASAMQFSDMNELLERYTYYASHSEPLIRIAQEKEKQEGLSARRAEIRENLSSYFRKAYNRQMNTSTEDDLNTFSNEFHTFIELRQKDQELMRSYEEVNNAIWVVKKENKSIQNIIDNILHQAHIDDYDSLDTAKELFEEGRKKHERLIQLTKVILPDKHAQMWDEATLRKKEHETTSIRETIDALITDNPHYKGLSCEDSPTSYSTTRAQFEEEIQKLREKESALTKNILERYQDAHDKKIELENENKRYKNHLEKTEQFKAAIDIAIETIERLAKESNRAWSALLNDKASTLLAQFNPDYEDIHFAEDLSFTLRDRKTKNLFLKDGMDYRVSAGARDQIYLAVRIALSEILSQGKTTLPLILDEPFSQTDDIRFLEGMRYITETLAKNHQIILLSCHRARHEHLKETQPEWFENHFNVIWLD